MDKPNFDCMNVWNPSQKDIDFKLNVGKEVSGKYPFNMFSQAALEDSYHNQIDMKVTKHLDGTFRYYIMNDDYINQNESTKTKEQIYTGEDMTIGYEQTSDAETTKIDNDSKFPLRVEAFGSLFEVVIDPATGDWIYTDTDGSHEQYKFSQAVLKDSYLKEYTLKFGVPITKIIVDKSIPELTQSGKDVISNQDVYPVTSNVITGYFPKYEIKADTKSHSHYYKDVSQYSEIDVYRVLDLFEVTNPCIQHAIKKLLKPGERGVKSVQKDLNEAIDSIKRALEMMKEDENV